jgi:hypothetical protein
MNTNSIPTKDLHDGAAYVLKAVLSDAPEAAGLWRLAPMVRDFVNHWPTVDADRTAVAGMRYDVLEEFDDLGAYTPGDDGVVHLPVRLSTRDGEVILELGPYDLNENDCAALGRAITARKRVQKHGAKLSK